MSSELILGGARSGKSRHAEQAAAASGLAVYVIVTAEALDEEMRVRIARHQADRPAGWNVVEAPRALAVALQATAAPERCVVVDCLTLWLANLLDGAENPMATSAAFGEFQAGIKDRCAEGPLPADATVVGSYRLPAG